MKKVLTISLTLIMILGLVGVSLAASYPEREIEWVIWSNPGGGSDVTARTMAIPLKKDHDVSLVVQNMAGGSGARAMAYVQKARADGYTWLFVTNTIITTVERNLTEYKYEDWIPVFMINDDPQVIVVKENSEIKNFQDLIEVGKKRKLKWGLSHLGGNDHIAINALAKSTGVQYDPIVFESGGEVMVGALSGVIDVFTANPSEIMGQVEADKLEVIASMSEKRLSVLPDVPTTEELGHDIQFGTWRGVFVKKGTPPEIVNKIEDLLFQAASTDMFKQFLEDNGMDFNVKKKEEFREFIDEQWKIFADGLKEIGIE